jgi:hypothetical protein
MTTRSLTPGRVVSVLAGAVCTMLAGAALPAAAAPAADQDVLASLKDPRGDVRIHQRVRGLTTDERTSIDLRKVTVESRGSVTRFTVQMRDVRRTRGWDQMVFVNFAQPAGSADGFSGSVGFSPHAPALSYAYLYFGEDMSDFESCDPLRAKVSWQRDLVSLDVPRRCMPESEAKVRVESLTGYFRSDAGGPWSSDKARFPGTVVLR